MIQAVNDATPYRVQFSDGRHSAYADTTQDKGGGESGFRPHELLEAALATCMNMAATAYASKHSIPLVRVVTEVSLDRSGSEQALFKYAVELTGDLTVEQREAIMTAVRTCPVRKTLSRHIRFLD
ncbi:MAG: OsmC family protein [Verrucomicrobiia bacterium]|jgi:putative redox protein